MISVLFKSMRLPFLVLTPVCVFLGASIAYADGFALNYLTFGIVMLGALSAHISVNTFNEYFDYRSGLDAATIKTPFSGGSGALIEAPNASGAVLTLAFFTLVLTISSGIYLVWVQGLTLLMIGMLGVLIVTTYTPWINQNPLICLIAPGAGFGLLMVSGSYIALTGNISHQAFIIALVPFFLVNNLLLLNQFPDTDADRQHGRLHIPIVYGKTASAWVYLSFVVLTAITLISGVAFAILPSSAYTALIPLIAGFVAFKGAIQHADELEKLIPYLAANVICAVLTPLVLAISIAISHS